MKIYENLKEHLDKLLFAEGRLVSQRVKPMIFEKYDDGDLLKAVIEATSFLPEDVKISERIYCIMHDIVSRPICKQCSEGFVSFPKYSEGYKDYCSARCVNASDDVRKLRVERNLEKYGVESPTMLASTKAKMKKTMVEKYGEDYNKVILAKREETNLKKYGVKNPSQVEEFKKKREETNMRLFGHKSSLGNEDFRSRVKKTIREKFGVDNVSQNASVKETKRLKSLEKFGTDCVLQNEDIKNRIKNTHIEKYGVENPSQNEEIKAKKVETTRKNYGVDSPFQLREQIEATCMEKYGFPNPMMSDEIKQRAIDSSIQKYGTAYPAASDIVKEKIENTVFERYGVRNIWESSEIKEKIKETNMQLYGYDHRLKHPDVRKQYSEMLQKKSFEGDLQNIKDCVCRLNEASNGHDVVITYSEGNYNVSCNVCKNVTVLKKSTIYQRAERGVTPCSHCMPKNSSVETLFFSFINDIYDGTALPNDRSTIGPKEIDILLPEISTGIELHGVYWHSDEFVSKSYHYDKMKACESKGIRLLQFFEDEIEQAMMLTYSIIANSGKLRNDLDFEYLNEEYGLSILPPRKFYGRKTSLKSIPAEKKKPYKEFLSRYHVQGDDNAKYYYSLEAEDGEILSVMTFKKMTVDKNQRSSNGDDTYELSRYATVPGTQVVGGFKRLMKAFLNEVPGAKVMTYSNLRYSSEFDNVYMKNGFKKVGFTGVNYYYFFEGRRMHRFGFRKDILYNSILPKYGVPVSEDYKEESESGMVAKLNDYGIPIKKIYDCGNLKWILETTDENTN